MGTPQFTPEQMATLQLLFSQNLHNSPIDFGLPQRYNSPYIMEDLDEGVYEQMAKRGHGEGSVFFNEKRQRWQAAVSLGYREDGSRNRKILSADTESEIWQAYNQFMGNGVALKPQTMQEVQSEQVTFEECYNKYLLSIEGQGSERAFSGKVLLSKPIIAELGHYKLQELTEDIMRRYVNSWTSKTYTKGKKTSLYSQQYIGKIYVNLKCVLKYAKKNKWILENPMEDIAKPDAKKFVEDEEKALTPEEINLILTALTDKPMLKTLVLVMAYTGIRPGEAEALRFSDFDIKNKTISIKRALSESKQADITTKKTMGAVPIIKMLKNERGTKKEYARRVLCVSDNVLTAVLEWEQTVNKNQKLVAMKKENGTEEFMFVKPSDGKLGLPFYYGDEYKKELKRNGLDGGIYRLYRFRHTYCTRLFKVHKLDPKTVQLMMGDNSMDMVMRVYNSVNKGDILSASGDFATEMDTALGA